MVGDLESGKPRKGEDTENWEKIWPAAKHGQQVDWSPSFQLSLRSSFHFAVHHFPFPPHITAHGPFLIALLIKEYLEFIGLYLLTECAHQESGVLLKFTVTCSFTRRQPISRHPDQTIRWARRTSIPPWVIVGALPTRPPVTRSVSEGQSFREVQKSRQITRQRERVLTWTLIPP